MSAHSFISCILFSHSTHQKNCLDIENNHKFMTSEFKYILYVCAYGWLVWATPSFLISPAWKMVFPKVQAASTIDDAKYFSPKYVWGSSQKTDRKDVCFSQKWAAHTYVCFISVFFGKGISRSISRTNISHCLFL
jgi:hypothetical protein